MTQIGRMEGMLQALTLTLLPEGEGTQKKGWFGGLWQDPDFAKFWVSRTVSNFGILMGALQFVAVLVLGATPFQMGVLVALGVAPSIVIGFFAGVIADRIRRRPILIVSELGRFALLASIPAAFLIGQLRIEQLYVVAFFNGVLTTFFDVANRSYLPTLVNRSELVDANSKLTASESFAEVTAFSIGGWIAQLSNSVAVAAIGGLTFLVSAFSLAVIRKEEPAAELSEQGGSVAREIWEGCGVERPPAAGIGHGQRCRELGERHARRGGAGLWSSGTWVWARRAGNDIRYWWDKFDIRFDIRGLGCAQIRLWACACGWLCGVHAYNTVYPVGARRCY